MDINSAVYRDVAIMEDHLDDAMHSLDEVHATSVQYGYLKNVRDGAREIRGLLEILVTELHASVDDAESEEGL